MSTRRLGCSRPERSTSLTPSRNGNNSLSELRPYANPSASANTAQSMTSLSTCSATQKEGVWERFVARNVSFKMYHAWATTQGGLSERETHQERARFEQTPGWPSKIRGGS
eukprot:5685307-Alexandrium_andersonii.AAC.1